MNSSNVADEPIEGDLSDEALDRDRVMTACVSLSSDRAER